MSKPKFFFTDVFTDRSYGGNQLATFVDCEALSDAEMQQIAREINFSETTFITAREPRDGGYDVRIFTPQAEVEFAGHPVLGTAHVIRNQLRLSSASEIVLNLRIGQIPVSFEETAAGRSVLWMKQMPPQFGGRIDAGRVAEVLGIAASDIEAHWPVEEVSTGFPTLIIPLKSLAALKQVRIDREKYFALIGDAWAKLVLVFSREAYEAGHALSVRMFGDYYGVPEDPATGSSNGCLAAYLVRHRVLGATEIDVVSGQGYEIGRPSSLMLRAMEMQSGIEVRVGGSVVDVAHGVWR